MPLTSLTTARMTMTATLLHRGDVVEDITQPSDGQVVDPNDIDLNDYGTWEDSQDPLTGQIVKVWTPYPDTTNYYPGSFQPPTGATPNARPNQVSVRQNIPCIARGVVDGGIRVAGTTERFGEEYENVDYVKMWLPPDVLVTKRDRITNIRDRRGRIQWLDEEYYIAGRPETLRATVYNVNGVTPLFDALNNLVEWYVMLERVTEQ